MDCPDCGCPMQIEKQETKGNDIVYTIETWWYCPVCDCPPENEVGHDER